MPITVETRRGAHPTCATKCLPRRVVAQVKSVSSRGDVARVPPVPDGKPSTVSCALPPGGSCEGVSEYLGVDECVCALTLNSARTPIGKCEWANVPQYHT